MQPFLGITPAKTLGAPSASDAPASDARAASNPANGQAFRSALNAANQRSGGSGSAERGSGRPTESASTEASAVSSEHGSLSSEGESTEEAASSAEAMAMLLSWLVPVTPTSAPAAPAITGPVGSGTAPTTPIGAAAEGALVASFGVLTALPNGAGGGSVTTAADLENLAGTADETASSTSAPTVTLAAGQADPALVASIPSTAEGPGMTARPDGAPRTATTSTSPAIDPDLLAAMQAAADARAEARAAGTTTSATGSAASAQAHGTTTATDLASLAADFGAQIVARPGAPVPSAIGEATLADEAQLPPAGSTAQAAGAGVAAGVQLPGRAVAAVGASAQGSGGTLAEALEAGPEGVSATQPGQAGAEARTDFQATLGAAGTNGVGQAQDVETVPASATAAPPVASQIADGALLAARRIGQSVEMILQPEGLGSVILRVTAERAGLAVHIAVENPQSRELVQASWPQLQQALEQRGLTVQSLLLDLSSGRNGGQGFQAFQQFSGQQFTGQQARGGSASADRRGSLTVAAVDEGPRVQSGAGAASRVDYRI